MNKDLALQLLSGAGTPDEVRDIMKKSAYDDKVCEAGLKKLKLNKWTEPQLLALMQESGYKEIFSYACAPFLSLAGKTNLEIFKLLAATKNNWKIVEVATKVLKMEQESENVIVSLLNSTSNEKLYELCQLFLKLETKSEAELMQLLFRLNYSHEAGPFIAPYLKQPKNLLAVINKYKEEHREDTRQICLAGLMLSERNDTELMAIAKASQYNLSVCEAAVKYLKDLANILFVLIKTNFHHLACANVMEKMPTDDHIMLLWEKNQFSKEVTLAALPRLQLETNLNAIWKSQGQYDEIRLMVISCLPLAVKTEDELAEVIKKDQYHNDAVRACLPYLDLKNKSGKEIMSLLKKTGFHKGACKILFSQSKLKKMTEKEIFTLLTENGFPENVGKVFGPFLTTEEYLVRFVREANHQENYWIKPFTDLLQRKKNDYEILAILDKLYGAEVDRVAIKFLNQKENIIKLMDHHSDPTLTQLGLKRLAELEGQKSGRKLAKTKV